MQNTLRALATNEHQQTQCFLAACNSGSAPGVASARVGASALLVASALPTPRPPPGSLADPLLGPLADPLLGPLGDPLLGLLGDPLPGPLEDPLLGPLEGPLLGTQVDPSHGTHVDL